MSNADAPYAFKLSYGEAPYDIHVEAGFLGNDILVSVTGGTRPHIGAVALAEPEDAVHPVTRQKGTYLVSCSSKTQGTSPFVLSSRGHKDAVLAEMFAKGFCEKFGVNVCAVAGVHVDDAGPEEIALLVGNAEALLRLALDGLICPDG